ncbi:biotin carboxylase N-terminal domain-containing protein, partial [Candidatus Symbiopectobacterium sp. NZEC135]|uniref:biotin carboxylase N-terminal domain-containing protein n=1 Tax=Candidatus Symbiopectobacterium sp. NZEC135 TaxID=2820471 RepID=UPI0029CABEE5
MFNKVLIANRGAIACRIQRTLRELAVGNVAVYADADSASLHVQHADIAVLLGEGPATHTYLAVDKILRAARQSGAEAIHPGYGFLSENAAFAQACEREGFAFIGPTPEQLRLFGLKHTARALAKERGLPLLEGSALLADIDEALSAAQAVGYPVMLKSTAGGGGIGMRVCHGEAELRDAYDSVRRLGQE